MYLLYRHGRIREDVVILEGSQNGERSGSCTRQIHLDPNIPKFGDKFGGRP